METFAIEDLDCMIDLHLHLDGAISPASARQLAQLQGIPIPEKEEDLLRMLRVGDDCSSLEEFLEKFAFPCALIQTKEGIRMAFSNLLKELQEQGVMYAEIRIAPQKSMDKGLTQDEVVAAALEGMQAAGMDSGLILCCMRGKDNNDQNRETIYTAAKYLGQGVAAVDLAGAESLFPTADFADLFALAREKKVPFTIHAGEDDGPKSVRAALDFGAARIGHGVRSLADPALAAELAARQIPLELCPTSNVKTSIVKSIADWPLRELLAAGLNITINSDDPSIEGTSIKEEYRKLIENFGIGKKEVKQLLLNAANASFAGDAVKQKMIATINHSLK